MPEEESQDKKIVIYFPEKKATKRSESESESESVFGLFRLEVINCIFFFEDTKTNLLPISAHIQDTQHSSSE